MIPQLLIEIDEHFAKAIDLAFGKGAFKEWLSKVRTILPTAWSSTENAPPIFIVLSEQLQESLMTPQDRELMRRLEFDEDGVVMTDRFAVQVLPVESTMKDIPVTVPVRICSVPAKEEGQ